MWTKAYGMSGSEEARSIELTTDGGFIIAGHTNSFGQGDDMLLIKTDSTGYSPCYMYNTSTLVDTAIAIAGNPNIQIGHGTTRGSTTTIVDSPLHDGSSCPAVGINKVNDSGIVINIYPNPGNGNNIIRYSLQAASDINFSIYNSMGQQISFVDDTW